MTAELTWTCSSWTPVLGPRREAGPRTWAPWGPRNWWSLSPCVGVGGTHQPTPLLPNLGCPGIPKPALVQRPRHVLGMPRPQEATSSCGRTLLAWGQNPGLARAIGGLDSVSLCVGPGGAQIPAAPTESGARPAHVPLGEELVSYAGCAALQEGQWVEAGHSGSSAPLTCTHPVGVPCLPSIPGYSMGNPGF